MIPATVMRLVRPKASESLDGFVIGAFGATMFTAAWTLTRLAPLFETGVTAGPRPIDNRVNALASNWRWSEVIHISENLR